MIYGKNNLDLNDDGSQSELAVGLPRSVLSNDYNGLSGKYL